MRMHQERAEWRSKMPLSEGLRGWVVTERRPTRANGRLAICASLSPVSARLVLDSLPARGHSLQQDPHALNMTEHGRNVQRRPAVLRRGGKQPEENEGSGRLGEEVRHSSVR